MSDLKLDLALRKEEARETLKKLKSAYTSPENSDPAMPTLATYSLRGVCADPTTTFVLVPFPESREESADVVPTSLPAEQWWCLRWGPPKSNIGWGETPTASYEVKKVTEEEVFEAMRTTGDGSLFAVYASENALNPKGGINSTLPGPLKVCQVYFGPAIVLYADEIWRRLSSTGITRHLKPSYNLLRLEEKGITTGLRTTMRPWT